ncbi:MAG: flavin reductase family protein [Chloroflexota bacterium]
MIKEASHMTKIPIGAKPLIYPMPILLIGADVDGVPNFMAAAWCGVVCGNPPMISAAIVHSRHTLKGIRQNDTFSANVPSREMVKETDYCGIVSGSRVNKVEACRFEVFYGKLKSAPMISRCPVNLECRVVHLLNLGSHELVIGQVEEVHVTDSCLTNGDPDVDKINPMIRVTRPANDYRAFGEPVGKAFSIGKEMEI